MFEVNHSVDVLIVCESFVDFYFVFYDSSKQVVRDAGVKGGVVFVCENVDVKVVIHIALSV